MQEMSEIESFYLETDETTFSHSLMTIFKKKNTMSMFYPCIRGREILPKKIGIPGYAFECFEEFSSYTRTGAIYNLAFDPNGKYLVSMGDSTELTISDPSSNRVVANVADAHGAAINICNFWDSHLFQTGSEDNTIKLWDVRMMDNCVSTFFGHTDMVKNIEKHSDTKFLSSGFDGTIRLWDINTTYDPHEIRNNSIFSSVDFVRMLYIPERNKLILSTIYDMIICINNFNLETIDDLNLDVDELIEYHSESEIWEEELIEIPDIFLRKENRVEILYEAGLSGLVTHFDLSPCGKFLLTRRTDVLAEYSCVFDLDKESPLLNRLMDEETNESDNTEELFPVSLVAFIEDSNAAEDFVKGSCFSNCSSVIVSPFYGGFRVIEWKKYRDQVLSLDEDIITTTLPIKQTVKGDSTFYNTYLTSRTLSTRYHPHLPIIASGDISGTVKIHQPRF